MTYDAILARLKALPADTRRRLVVQSMPFGDIIDNDTREVFVLRQDRPDWRDMAYALCRAAKAEDTP
jgi:hypothetical protein